MTKNFIIFLAVIIGIPLLTISFILITGIGLKNNVSPEIKEKMRPITIDYWRVWDGPEDFSEIIQKYNRLHPNITIKYHKLRYDEYEDALLEAFATDRGPDILSLHNTWLRGYQSRGLLLPMLNEITMVFPHIETGLKKEVVYDKRTKKSPSLSFIKDAYVDTVYDDIVIRTKNEDSKTASNKVFGFPLAIDTMAMFYNKDLFNNAGIANPPEYWNREFQQDVKKLSKQNNKGQIIQAGVALGGSDNINRSTDILAVLMMQNGAEMMRGTEVAFQTKPAGFQDKNYNPGLDALRFYTDFANPAKEVYSWNSTLGNSLDMFIDNKLAIIFGYSYMLEDIKARAPKLNFSIAPLPQIESNSHINFANYWVETVSKKTDHPEEAWDFIQFMARKDNVKKYLDSTKKSPALRSLIDEYSEDPDAGIFTNQVLTAKSWYKGDDANTAETLIKDMIDKANDSQMPLSDIIGQAASKVQQTINKN